jgi:Ca2+-binding RTX toxin-like protein
MVVAILFLAVPAGAAAAGVENEGAETVYLGDDSIDDVAVTVADPAEWIFQRAGAGGALMTAGSGCEDTEADGTRVACDITGTARITLAGGADELIGGAPGNVLVVDAGEGDDSLVIGNSAAANTLEGGGGDDTFEVGGATGQNAIEGGDGDDTVMHPNGANEISGGADVDTIVYQNDFADSFSVSLDDDADDGPSADENVHSDVENLTGGQESDRFTGSGGANVLRGGQGNDLIDGGAGQDTLEGGENDDQMLARDGEADEVDCGFGEDFAVVDVLDAVVGCEQIVFPDAPGGITKTVAPPVLITIGDPKPRGPSFKAGRTVLIRAGSGRESFTCRAPAGDSCKVAGALTVRRGGTVRIGSVSGRVAGGKAGRLTVRLNAAGRDLLAETGRLTARLGGTVTNRSGERRPLRVTITLAAAQPRAGTSGR